MASSCTQVCGWIGALTSCLCFGSFAVPVRSHTARSLHIDPLVFQSYKTILCFLTSWIFVYILDQPITFTPWGIVSASFWVPAAVAAIYAIQNAGLATAIGISGSCIVLVSFSWGIFVFEEQVRSKTIASLAVFFMICGIVGMSYFSSPTVSSGNSTSCTLCKKETHMAGTPVPMHPKRNPIPFQRPITYQNVPHEDDPYPSNSNPLEIDPPLHSLCTCDKVQIWGWTISKRTSGLIAAAINGLWGGSILVPMHFAP
jgi:hypothetical protein